MIEDRCSVVSTGGMWRGLRSGAICVTPSAGRGVWRGGCWGQLWRHHLAGAPSDAPSSIHDSEQPWRTLSLSLSLIVRDCSRLRQA